MAGALGLLLARDSTRQSCLSQAGCDILPYVAFRTLARTGGALVEAGNSEPGAADSAADSATDFAAVARAIIESIPSAHLLRSPWDESRSALVWTNYLSALDFERLYFRQEDLDEFEPLRLSLPEALGEGDLTFADSAFERFQTRVGERVQFVESLLQEPLNFEVEEAYRWRRRDAPWPADRDEQDELWRRRVKNEVLGRMINRELSDSATDPENDPPQAMDPEADGVPEADADPLPGDEPPEGAEGAREPRMPEGPVHAPEPEDLDDEAFVLRRYRRFLGLLEDSDEEYRMSRFFSAVASAYDPHSAYLSPAALEDFGINMQLSLEGVGAQLRSEDGAARVVEIIPGGPAARDTRDIRLMPGDRIIGVGQGDEPVVDTLHWPLYRTVRLIRGPKGSKVVLRVLPASDPTGTEVRYVDLIRDEVRLEEQAAVSAIETVTDAEGNDRRLGLIRLPTFYTSVDEQGERRGASLDVARLLAKLNQEDVDGLVLDLRGNGGGALREAIDLVGLFIPSGPVVLVRERSRVHTLMDREPAVAFRRPMVVLIDRVSASASEIVAGALQDYGRAVVVGDSRSHGKGTVQQIIPLDTNGNSGSLKITNASFYRISGSSTQSRGIESDIVLPSPFDYFVDLGEDRLPNAIPWSTVRPVSYRRVATLDPTLEVLRERSSARLAENEDWQRHLRRLQRIERLQQLEALPLQLEERRAFARDERVLRELDEDGEEGEARRTDRGKARRAEDAVLDEALLILADLIEVFGPMEPLLKPAQRGGDSLFDLFFR